MPRDQDKGVGWEEGRGQGRFLCTSDSCVEGRGGAWQTFLGGVVRATGAAGAKALRLVCVQGFREWRRGQGFYSQGRVGLASWSLKRE